MKYLDKLRQKSEAEKRNIAFFSSLIITLFIVLIWIFSSVLTYDAKETENLANPISSFTEEFKNIFE